MTFATATQCKGCNAQLRADHSQSSQPPRLAARNSGSSESNSSHARAVGLVFILMVCVIAAGAFKFRAALFERFGGSLKYVDAIKQSPEFKSPVWVRANQQEITVKHAISGYGEVPRYLNSGIIVREVEVLQSLGLLDVAQYETTEAGPSRWLFSQDTYHAKHYRINLTSLGAQEAASWETVHEPFLDGPSSTREPVAWWHVPIGDREFGAVTKVGEIHNEGQGDTVDVEFSYKWRPNNIGLAFDKATAADAIPTSARKAAELLTWDSRKPYLAVAHMERIGNQWKVAGVTFSSEESVRKALTYAVY